MYLSSALFSLQTFSKAADTGIPELQSFVRELTRVRKIQGTQRLLRIVGQFVSDVLSYLCDEGTSVCNECESTPLVTFTSGCHYQKGILSVL